MRLSPETQQAKRFAPPGCCVENVVEPPSATNMNQIVFSIAGFMVVQLSFLSSAALILASSWLGINLLA